MGAWGTGREGGRALDLWCQVSVPPVLSRWWNLPTCRRGWEPGASARELDSPPGLPGRPWRRISVPAAGEGGKGELSEVPSEILQDLGSRQEPSRAMGGGWTWSRRGLSGPRLCGSLAPVTSEMGTTPPVAGHPGCERAGFPWRPGCLRLGPGLRCVVLLYPDNMWGLGLLLASHAGPHLPIPPLVSKRSSVDLFFTLGRRLGCK